MKTESEIDAIRQELQSEARGLPAMRYKDVVYLVSKENAIESYCDTLTFLYEPQPTFEEYLTTNFSKANKIYFRS